MKPGIPLRFIKFRFPHHAPPSGYDRLCEFIDAPNVELSAPLYWAGETVLRPYCLWCAKHGGKFEYSRYDCVMECQFLWDALLSERNTLYHFIYAEKSFHLSERFVKRLRARGHRLVGTMHHMPEQQAWLFESHKHFRAFDALLTMDERSIPFWEEVTGRKNVHQVGHGVDTDFFTPAQGDRDRVVFAGSHERDFESLRSVISRLAERFDLNFDLVGSAPMLQEIGDRYPNVSVHSWVSLRQYRDLLQRASVLLLPLHASTVCNVVLEALACGTPVVTTAGGIEHYLDRQSAVVVDAGDVDAMIKGVERVLDSGQTMRQGARARALRFSWHEVAKQHLAVYRWVESQPVPI